MITTNPFAQLNAASPDIFTPGTMQTYIVLMILFVIGGTLFDVWHKKSAKYFSMQAEDAKKHAKREVSGSDKTSMLISTVTSEVLTSSEFSNQKRRLSHLMTMYGFITFVATTAIMIFAYPQTIETPILALLWHLGALMLCVGGYWFWFAIRVDVAAEGKPWYKISYRSDMFILSLLATCTFALLWSLTSGMGLFFVLFIASATFLFTTVIWSKFAHMFFKPAAAYDKKIKTADGSNQGLPEDFDLNSKALQDKFPDIPTYMGENPPNMGPGIRRGTTSNY